MTKKYSKNEGLIIVANYNQSHEITSFLLRLKIYYPIENILIVDDGSSDGSDLLALDMGYKVIKHSKNFGIGAAIRTGIHEARNRDLKFVTVMSSNGKIRPEDLPTVIGPILDGTADYTTGSRFIEGGKSPGLPIFRRFAIPLISIFCSMILMKKFSDITCGYRSYKINLFTNVDVNINQDWLNRYELEYYIHYWACKKKVKMIEVPVTIEYGHLEKNRKSKIRPFTGWWSMMRPFVLLSLGLKK
jgi:dolichol-phosphate mannosyltransferase